MKKALLCLAIISSGCNFNATRTPTPQEDVLVVGRVRAVAQRAQEPGVWDVEVRIQVPESLKGVMEKERRPVPQGEKELVARVKVDSTAVCIVDGRPVELFQLRVGEEVAVVPVSGSCAMVGEDQLLADAAEVYQFKSYQVRFLPRSLSSLPAWVSEPADPQLVNSAGVETAPLPLAGGKVLYFSAGLLPPWAEGEAPRGAVRPGMKVGEGLAPWAARGGLRPYRTAFQGGRWSPPEPVEFPGLSPEASVRLTWVNEEETECLLEVREPERGPRLLAARRQSARDPWGPLTPVPEAGEKPSGDGQRFGRAGSSLVWTVYENDSADLWLALPGATPLPLEPRINTLGVEWAPRVGPNTTLYFCRGDRQLLFASQTVQEVRLPGQQRIPFSEAAPTADGQLLFYRLPRYTPGQIAWDLAVSRWEGNGWSTPTPLDQFRP